MALLLIQTDWRTALMIGGAVGVILSFVFVFSGDILREDATRKQKTKAEAPLRSMINRGVILLFLFYVLTSSANIGLTAFAPIYLPTLYGLSVERRASSCRSCCSAMRSARCSAAGWPIRQSGTTWC